jgi:hypothetical protein
MSFALYPPEDITTSPIFMSCYVPRQQMNLRKIRELKLKEASAENPYQVSWQAF